MGSSAAKVGLFVVLALVLMAGIYIWLEGSFLGTPTTPIVAEFSNAQGSRRARSCGWRGSRSAK